MGCKKEARFLNPNLILVQKMEYLAKSFTQPLLNIKKSRPNGLGLRVSP
jgi:hypothetical protein